MQNDVSRPLPRLSLACDREVVELFAFSRNLLEGERLGSCVDDRKRVDIRNEVGSEFLPA